MSETLRVLTMLPGLTIRSKNPPVTDLSQWQIPPERKVAQGSCRGKCEKIKKIQMHQLLLDRSLKKATFQLLLYALIEAQQVRHEIKRTWNLTARQREGDRRATSLILNHC